jgi:hypothetical protein
MHDHVPLRVTIHCGRPNIVAAQTIIRPKLFTSETHIGIARGGIARRGIRLPVSFRLGKQSRADEEYEQSREDTAIQSCYHVTLLSRNLWLSEEAERSY